MSQYNLRRLMQQEIYTPIDTDGYGIAPAILFFLMAGGATTTAVVIGEQEKKEREAAEAEAAAQPTELETYLSEEPGKKRGLQLHQRRNRLRRLVFGSSVGDMGSLLPNYQFPTINRGDTDSDYDEWLKGAARERKMSPRAITELGAKVADGKDTFANFATGGFPVNLNRFGDYYYLNRLKLYNTGEDNNELPNAGLITAINFFLFGGLSDTHSPYKSGVSGEISEAHDAIITEDRLNIGWMNKFDIDSERALRIYQRYFDLPYTGQVDKATWSHMLFGQGDLCDPMPPGGCPVLKMMGEESWDYDPPNREVSDIDPIVAEDPSRKLEEEIKEKLAKQEKEEQSRKWYAKPEAVVPAVLGIVGIALIVRAVRKS